MSPEIRKSRLALVLITFLAYGPALFTGFLYDDHILIEANPQIRSWSTGVLSKDFSSGVFGHPGTGTDFYRPLQTFSTRVEYTLWKLHPLPYHLTNLLLHLGNVLLLYQLLLVLGFGNRLGFLTSGLFAAHPVIVEAMLMVSGRGEQMGLLFTLGAILLTLRGGVIPLGVGVLSYGLALLSKESAVVTPLLLACVLYLQKRPTSRYKILLPMIVLTPVYLALRHHAMGALPDLTHLNPLRFFYLAFPQVLLNYARILLFPFDLHTDRLLALPFGRAWPLATAGVLAGALWIWRRGPRWAIFCLAWYVVSLLPKSVLMMSGSFMSDHWAYPLIPALALPIAQALSRGWEASRDAVRIGVRRAAAGLLILEVTVLYYNIHTRNTDEKLYRSALRYTSSATMHYNLGMVLLSQHRPADALPHFEAILATRPQDLEARQALAVTRTLLQKSSSRR